MYTLWEERIPYGLVIVETSLVFGDASGISAFPREALVNMMPRFFNLVVHM